MVDLDWVPALKACRRNHLHTKSEIHILTLRECVFLTFVNCSWISSTLMPLIGKEKKKNGSVFFCFFFIPHRLHVLSDSRGKEKKKKTVINLRVQEWKVGSWMRCSCQTALEPVALHKCRWFFWANHSVEMHHESHLDWRDLRHYIWLTNSDLKPKPVFWQ